MPFTFAHPAIVLPFASLPKRFVSVTGLIVGSMVPDFEYFFRLRVKSDYSHSWPGIFLFDLPVGIVTCLFFQLVVKRSLVQNLPGGIQSRLPKEIDTNWAPYFERYWPVVVLSLFVGILSHLLWDGFTHRGGFGVLAFESLSRSYKLFGHDIPGFKIAQHASSVIGAIFIFAFISKHPKVRQACTPSIRYWQWVFLWGFLLLAGKLIFSKNISSGNLIVAGIAALFVGLILSPLSLRLIYNRSK
ncbi:MAG: DUF4184 family protein [Chitinophagaceae bacterium]